MTDWHALSADPDHATHVLGTAFPALTPSHIRAATGERGRFVSRMAGLHDLTEREAEELLDVRLSLAEPARQIAAQ